MFVGQWRTLVETALGRNGRFLTMVVPWDIYATAKLILDQHGPEGVRFFTKIKTMTSRWPTGIRSGADFHIPTMG